MADAFVLDFEVVFNDFIKTQEKTWKHDRALTVGASEAFDCLRKIGFRKRGAEFGYAVDDGYTMPWGATHRGNMIENHFVAPAMAHLPKPLVALYVEQSNQETFISGKNSATPDGLIVNVPRGPVIVRYKTKEILINSHTGSIGLEIKSIDPRTNLKEEKAKHYGQSQIGLGIVREKTEHTPDHWIILYVNASFLDDITPFVVEWNPEVYEAAKIRAGMIFDCDDPAKLPPEGKFDNACDYCEFTNACGEAEFSKWFKLDEAPGDDEKAALIEPLVAEYIWAKEEADEATKKAEGLKQGLKDRLAELGCRRLRGPNWSLSWSHQEGRKTLDKAALERDGIDLSQYEKVGKGFDVLKVS
jgi:hypothetical protein